MDPNQAPERTEYRGQTFCFCSLGCKNRFEREPERYVSGARDDVHGQDAPMPR
jgi:Cu+-exporting ATPase